MRVVDTVYYLYSDHLGSTSLTTNSGGIHSQQCYFPYGEVRWSSGTLPTDYTYTGQRAETGIGLMDYRARYYSPRLGRFISPDTIVPGASKPQMLNRYMYAAGNPVVYTDPSGHAYDSGGPSGKSPLAQDPWWSAAANYLAGAVSQFCDDMTVGIVSDIVEQTTGGIGPLDNTSDAFQAGRQLGRYASYAQGILEIGAGLVTFATTTASAPAAIGAGTLTGGPAGTAVGEVAVAEGAAVAEVGHGIAVIGHNLRDPDPLLNMANKSGGRPGPNYA